MPTGACSWQSATRTSPSSRCQPTAAAHMQQHNFGGGEACDGVCGVSRNRQRPTDRQQPIDDKHYAGSSCTPTMTLALLLRAPPAGLLLSRFYQELDFPWSLDPQLVLDLIPKVCCCVLTRTGQTRPGSGLGPMCVCPAACSPPCAAVPARVNLHHLLVNHTYRWWPSSHKRWAVCIRSRRLQGTCPRCARCNSSQQQRLQRAHTAHVMC